MGYCSSEEACPVLKNLDSYHTSPRKVSHGDNQSFVEGLFVFEDFAYNFYYKLYLSISVMICYQKDDAHSTKTISCLVSFEPLVGNPVIQTCHRLFRQRTSAKPSFEAHKHNRINLLCDLVQLQFN